MIRPFEGSLFAEGCLREAITELPDWDGVSASALDELEAALRARFDRFPTDLTPNESQTEEDLIWPVLARLGWTAHLRQQNLSPVGRQDVPDGLLFADRAAKDRANRFAEEWKRYGHGLAVVESKRWLRPLDRRSGRRGEESAPSTQMLRYLRRIDDVTTGKVRWGILTNGARWRLYWAGARSVSEQFFEIDLATVLGQPVDGGERLPADTRRHWLKVFALVFGRDAFLPDAADKRTFHERAIAEARYHRERVAGSLSAVVFERVFPDLVRAIAEADPDAPLDEVRDAGLVVLYRLLFVLYAEDRDLLPVRDSRYDDYALRDRVRGDIGRRKDEGDVFSVAAARYWSAFDDLCRAIDSGDASIGLPPYNGGLFDRDGSALLSRVRLGDAVMADVIDALSFERTPLGRRYINYRDLGVQQLGSIYERLLEREVVREGGNIVVRPNVFARKDSGSYYTPDDLVDLIVREAVGSLVDSRMEAFAGEALDLVSSDVPEDRRMGRVKRLDPAERTLELKVCDPAMGSGHFLVNLVDYLADRVNRRHGRGRSPRGRIPLAVGGADRGDPQHDHGQRRGPGMDHRHGPTRRPTHRPPDGAETLRLRRGQEPDGGGTGQGLAVAAHLHRGRAAQLSGSSSPLRRQPVRHLCGARHPKGGGDEQPVPKGTARARHARGRAHADH